MSPVAPSATGSGESVALRTRLPVGWPQPFNRIATPVPWFMRRGDVEAAVAVEIRELELQAERRRERASVRRIRRRRCRAAHKGCCRSRRRDPAGRRRSTSPAVMRNAPGQRAGQFLRREAAGAVAEAAAARGGRSRRISMTPRSRRLSPLMSPSANTRDCEPGCSATLVGGAMNPPAPSPSSTEIRLGRACEPLNVV